MRAGSSASATKIQILADIGKKPDICEGSKTFHYSMTIRSPNFGIRNFVDGDTFADSETS
jgi:hypothetical protein